MYKVLADFGDFQVVETKTGIDLIDINYKKYHVPNSITRLNKKEKHNKEEKGAYIACVVSLATIIAFIIKWMIFGY